MSVFNSINKATIPLKFVQKAYTEGIYCDSPTNRKLGRVGMSYKAYAEKVAKEKEEKAPKKDYVILFDGGKEQYNFKSNISQESVIKEASKYAKEIAEANDFEKYDFNLEEDTEDWSIEDFDKKEYDWFAFKVRKIDNKFYLSVFDCRKGEYLVNEMLEKRWKDEKIKLNKKLKEEREKYGMQ